MMNTLTKEKRPKLALDFYPFLLKFIKKKKLKTNPSNHYL